MTGYNTVMRQVRLPFVDRADSAALRHAAGDTLAVWQTPALVEDSLLVIAELVGNVIQHTGSGGELVLSCRPDTVLIEVSDGSRAMPDPQRPDPRRIGGRGLLLVAAMSRSWGSERTADGKVVWAELLRDEPVPALS